MTEALRLNIFWKFIKYAGIDVMSKPLASMEQGGVGVSVVVAGGERVSVLKCARIKRRRLQIT